MTAADNVADIRAWAAAQGLPVNNRGRLPAHVVTAYADATSADGGQAMARTTGKKTTARRPRKTTRSRSTARKTTARKATVPAVSTETVAAPAVAAANGVADLAGGLRTFLDAIETEVRAASRLSEQIDGLVAELNAAREEQAARLIALDTLQAAAEDGGLTSFLDKLIRPRKYRVTEVIPERLERA